MLPEQSNLVFAEVLHQIEKEYARLSVFFFGEQFQKRFRRFLVETG